MIEKTITLTGLPEVTEKQKFKLQLDHLKNDEDKTLIEKIEVLEMLFTSTRPKDNTGYSGNDNYILALSEDNRTIIEDKIMQLIDKL